MKINITNTKEIKSVKNLNQLNQLILTGKYIVLATNLKGNLKTKNFGVKEYVLARILD